MGDRGLGGVLQSSSWWQQDEEAVWGVGVFCNVEGFYGEARIVNVLKGGVGAPDKAPTIDVCSAYVKCALDAACTPSSSELGDEVKVLVGIHSQ